jgi:hypothetical protein
VAVTGRAHADTPRDGQDSGRIGRRTTAIASLFLLALFAVQQVWAQGQSEALMTRWGAEVDPAAVLPEYPRPQLVREAWLNLNGAWDYALTQPDAGAPQGYEGQILVPFPLESQLSGVAKELNGRRLWYRRSFELPPSWEGQRILLHFGAVDWDATVWLNEHEVGRHRGGYDPFTFDITEALIAGSQELVVAVIDPSDAGTQPRGKQVREPEGIWYTPSSGIWQTVWLEPVPAWSIAELRLSSDLEANTVRAEVGVRGAPPNGGGTVTAQLLAEGRPIASASGALDEALELTVAAPRLWSPNDPFLYDLILRLEREDEVIDEVVSYHGMREIAIGPGSDGHLRLHLNGEPLFQYGLLDQGFWPDGLYTAPSDEALRYDLEVTKRLGFNTVRKHVKIEPARWYYWADRLGLLVWQDMPSGDAFVGNGGGEIARDPASADQFERELKRMVNSLGNHPSIVMWVIFNEGWGQYDSERLTAWLRGHDPSRLVNAASGWNDLGAGDVFDIHRYPGPGAPDADGERASVLGEFGGLGLAQPGHLWQEDENWGYVGLPTVQALDERYRTLLAELRELIVRRGLTAAIYTQTTDVESEVNGLMTYDREIIKLEPVALAFANRIVFRPLPRVEALVPTAETAEHPWRFTTDDPGDSWTDPDFDDTGWHMGPGGFGQIDSPGALVGTEWVERDIWLRTTFELDTLPQNPYLRLHHDEDIEVYVNSLLLRKLPFYTLAYVDVTIEPDSVDAFRLGTNTLAVHCRRSGFGQYCDAALFDSSEPLVR